MARAGAGVQRVIYVRGHFQCVTDKYSRTISDSTSTISCLASRSAIIVDKHILMYHYYALYICKCVFILYYLLFHLCSQYESVRINVSLCLMIAGAIVAAM